MGVDFATRLVFCAKIATFGSKIFPLPDEKWGKSMAIGKLKRISSFNVLKNAEGKAVKFIYRNPPFLGGCACKAAFGGIFFLTGE